MMMFWFDAVTSKEPLLFDAIAKELEKKGHQVIFTCRDYDYVVSLFKLLGRDVQVLGKHGGGSLYGKLKAGNERISLLADFIHNLGEKPDYHISFACPEATRVAFGFAIPIISINDSPHARAVAKLTVPFAKFLIYSSCIDSKSWLENGATEKQLYPYDGIDEVAWLKDFSPNEKVLEEFDLSQTDRFIVARPEESSAAYMLDQGIAGHTVLDKILDKIFQTYTGKAIVFPRYQSQKDTLLSKFGEKIITPPEAVDTSSLYYYSDFCITGGATMAREAAAVGTPSVSYYSKPLDVLEYISSIGIPLYNEYNLQDAIQRSLELIDKVENREEIRKQTKKILGTLESPVEKVLEIIND
jgi:predicted glycosyltransferase